jgi:flagellar biosynthesis protein FlhF
LRDVLESFRKPDQIVIDTHGMNPFSPEDMRDLARFVAAGNIEPILVLPAGLDADECGEMGRVYATVGVRHILPTRLDIARRLGGLLGAAHHGGLVFSDAGNTPKVADGLIQLTPQRLAHLLMPSASRKHSDARQSSKPAKG